MGRIVIKAAPDRDLYVDWSTIVEAPAFIGTRTEMLAYLGRQEHADHPMNDPNGRLDRADATGTSAAGDYSFFGACARGDLDACYALVDPFDREEVGR